MTAKHPMQPLVRKNGAVRFKENTIVRFLVDWAAGENGAAGYPRLDVPGGRAPDLNALAMMDFSKEDRTQLAQLIGYSVGGASELSYFDGRVLANAEKEVAKMLKRKKRK